MPLCLWLARPPALASTQHRAANRGVDGADSTAAPVIKHLTNHHYLRDIVDFGGYAPYVSLFARTPGNTLRGTCIPAAHASAGFVRIIRALALRATQPRMTRRELVINLVAGAAPGVGRMFRGAHFFSHVRWSVWLAWALSLGLAAALLMPLGSGR